MPAVQKSTLRSTRRAWAVGAATAATGLNVAAAASFGESLDLGDRR